MQPHFQIVSAAALLLGAVALLVPAWRVALLVLASGVQAKLKMLLATYQVLNASPLLT